MEAYEYAVKKAKTEMLPIEAPTGNLQLFVNL